LLYSRVVARARLIWILTIFTLLAAACGGESAAIEGAATEQAVAAAAPASSPLEAELGFASEPGRRQYQLITKQQEADTQMVQCMRSAGFFYAVGSAEDRLRAGAYVGDESRDFAASSGLGIATSFADALAADASRATSDAATNNLDYVASLTAEQAADYDVALLGELDPAAQSEAFEPAGCWGGAFTNVLRLLAVIEEFEPELVALNSRFDSDPRVVGFQTSWSQCMDGSGYRFSDEQAMVNDVYARLLDIELVEDQGITKLASRADLESLLAFEQEVAVASFDCRQSFASDATQLRYDYEQEFLDDNRFRIAELATATP